MKLVQADWLSADDLTSFDRAVCAAHIAPTNTAAYHQWHYAVDAELLRLVNHWHATGQCQHVEWFDSHHDAEGRPLSTDGALLRLRRCKEHSERAVKRLERSGSFTLRKNGKVTYHSTDIMRQLREHYALKTDPGYPAVNPLSYCGHTIAAKRLARFGPKHESNPRWWVERDHKTSAVMLVVEADPAARGWASDDDEVMEYDRGEGRSGEIAPVATCRACFPIELPCYKDDV